MADGLLVSLFLRVVDGVDYWLMQMRLGIVDVVCGPEPETAGDEMREADRERLRRAFPQMVLISANGFDTWH